MPSFDLSADEAEVLRTALVSYLDDLQEEISHTDDYEFREALQRRRDTLQSILERLAPPASS